MQLQTVSIIVSGKVQGVWFRKHTAVKAQELGLTGYVTNWASGDVQIIATGTLQQITALQNWCKTGPPLAQVKSVTTEALSLQLFETFQIRR